MSEELSDQPLISIVVGVRNMQDTIEPCINSLLNQSYENKEIIVINDGSDDNTESILQKIKNKNKNCHISIITTEKRGISHARNFGYKIANGEFVAYTDADCILMNNWLELVFPYFKDPKVALVGGVTRFKSDNSYTSIYRQIEFEKRYENIKKKEVVWAGGPGSIFRKSVLEEIGGFNPNWVHGEDAEISFLIYEKNYKIMKENSALTYHVAESKFRQLVFKGYRDGKAYVRATFFHPKTSLKNKFNTSWYLPYDMVFQPILFGLLILLMPMILLLWLLNINYFFILWGIWPDRFPNVFSVSVYLFFIIFLFLFFYSFIPSYYVAKRTKDHNTIYFFKSIVLHIIRGFAWGFSLIFGIINAMRYKFFSITKLDDYKLLDNHYYKIIPIERKITNFDYSRVSHGETDLISIVIVTYNNEKTIKHVLDSIFDSVGINYEVIIVDNNSQDKTVEAIKKIKNPRVKTYFCTKNYGLTKGNNFGAKKSKGKYLIFLNPDAIVEKNTIFGLYYAYLQLKTKYKKIILSPKIKPLSKGKQIFKLGTINTMGFAFFDHLDGYREKIVQRTDFVSGCCLFVSSQDFGDLNFFNSKYFMYYEDIEFSIRARYNGYKLFVINSFSVIHLKTDSDYKLTKFKYYYVERNRLSTLLQYTTNTKKTIIKILLFEPFMLIHAFYNSFLSTRASIYSFFLRNNKIISNKNVKKNVKISNKTRTKDLFFFSGFNPQYHLFLVILEWALKILNKV